MKQSGQIILFRFPQTDMTQGKPRPALIISESLGAYDDWLICMISTQLRHYIQGFDEIIHTDDSDFSTSGLRMPSVIRIGRLAIVDGAMMLGAIGEINPNRVRRIQENLASWITQSHDNK